MTTAFPGGLQALPSLIAGDAMTAVAAPHVTQHSTVNDTLVAVQKRLLGQQINVKEHGAIGNGVANDYAAIQAAIDACEALGGGVVYFPAGTYLIGTGLVVNKGVMLQGAQYAEDTTVFDGNAIGATTLYWSGAYAGGATMIRFISGTATARIFGGGVRDMQLAGANNCDIAIRASSTVCQEFANLAIREVRVAGLRLDSGNTTLSQSCHIRNFRFTYGAAASVQPAHGIVLTGEAGNALCTQHVLTDVMGTVYDGSLVYIGGADNNHLFRVFGNRAGGGTGFALRLANNGGFPSSNNVVHYIVGHVKNESQATGTVINLLDSESSSVTIDSGGQLHYRAIDYVNRELFRTHEFLMSGRLCVPATTFYLKNGAGVALAPLALAWPSWTLPDAQTSEITAQVLPPYDWNNGTITGVRFRFAYESTLNTATVFRIGVMAIAAGGNVNVTPTQQTVTVAHNVLQYRIIEHTLTLSSPVAFTRDMQIFLGIDRMGNDGADTSTATCKFIGAELIYVGTGPDSGGSGTYNVGPVGV